jgi:chromosome segregation ATPase
VNFQNTVTGMAGGTVTASDIRISLEQHNAITSELRAALQKRDQEVAEMKEAFGRIVSLETEVKLLHQQNDNLRCTLRTASSEMEKQLGAQLHAANNEIMALREERDALAARLDERNHE